jgi:hypothetical protein
MFLNYDCRRDREPLFEKTINTLASIAQGRASEEFNASQKSAAEAAQVRTAAMNTLSAIIEAITINADRAVELRERAGMGMGGESDLPPSGEAAEARARLAMERAAARALENEKALELAEAKMPAAAGPPLAALSHGAAPSPGASSQSQSQNLATSYEATKRRRRILEQAAVKFAVKQKKGIEFMQSVGLCDDTPESVAKAFHELKDTLDKTAMGDYMGEDKRECLPLWYQPCCSMSKCYLQRSISLYCTPTWTKSTSWASPLMPPSVGFCLGSVFPARLRRSIAW